MKKPELRFLPGLHTTCSPQAVAAWPRWDGFVTSTADGGEQDRLPQMGVPCIWWSNKCPGPPREKKSSLATSPRTWAASVCLCVPSKSEPTSAAGRLMNTNDCPVPCRGVFNTSHVSATLSNHLPKSARAAPPSHGKRHGDE